MADITKKRKKPSIGDLRRKDEMVMKKMDPDNPNVYYGTEDMAGLSRGITAEGLERIAMPDEDIWSDMDRIQEADTEEDIERRKRQLHSVWGPEDFKRENLPFTKFSPALGDDTNTRGFVERDRNLPTIEKLRIPANASPLTTVMTAKHELSHSRTSPRLQQFHQKENVPSLMSAPAKSRIEATSRVLQKLIDKGIPEEEAAAAISNDLVDPRDVYSIFGYPFRVDSTWENKLGKTWEDYEQKAPERLMRNIKNLRKKD